jgi:8-oxo-dGTP diphosphatase
MSSEVAATMEPLLISACALVDDDGRLLIQCRPPGKPMAGLWEFPGGKLEPGETPENALVRELAEELGIATQTACLAPAGFGTGLSEAGRPLILLVYVCRKWSGLPTPNDGQELRWVRPRDLHQLPMPPADKPVIALLDALI